MIYILSFIVGFVILCTVLCAAFYTVTRHTVTGAAMWSIYKTATSGGTTAEDFTRGAREELERLGLPVPDDLK